MKGDSEIRMAVHCNTVCGVLQGRKIFIFSEFHAASEKYVAWGSRIEVMSWGSTWDMQTTEGKVSL